MARNRLFKCASGPLPAYPSLSPQATHQRSDEVGKPARSLLEPLSGLLRLRDIYYLRILPQYPTTARPIPSIQSSSSNRRRPFEFDDVTFWIHDIHGRAVSLG